MFDIVDLFHCLLPHKKPWLREPVSGVGPNPYTLSPCGNLVDPFSDGLGNG